MLNKMTYYIFLCLFCVLMQQTLYGKKEIPREMQDIAINEHLGESLNMKALFFNDEHGMKQSFESYFFKGKPVILILGYYECPRLCSLVFNGFSNTARQIKWNIGNDYEVVIVSIDPTETPELAKKKKDGYVNHYGRMSARKGWHFLTGDEKNIKNLAAQIGFGYKYDEKFGHYAHAAVLTVLTPNALISRYLYGIDFKPNDLKLSLLEASNGKIGSVVEQILLISV